MKTARPCFRYRFLDSSWSQWGLLAFIDKMYNKYSQKLEIHFNKLKTNIVEVSKTWKPLAIHKSAKIKILIIFYDKYCQSIESISCPSMRWINCNWPPWENIRIILIAPKSRNTESSSKLSHVKKNRFQKPKTCSNTNFSLHFKGTWKINHVSNLHTFFSLYHTNVIKITKHQTHYSHATSAFAPCVTI